jgi:hypothetical protein
VVTSVHTLGPDWPSSVTAKKNENQVMVKKKIYAKYHLSKFLILVLFSSIEHTTSMSSAEWKLSPIFSCFFCRIFVKLYFLSNIILYSKGFLKKNSIVYW